jgi:hypothetical protein
MFYVSDDINAVCKIYIWYDNCRWWLWRIICIRMEIFSLVLYWNQKICQVNKYNMQKKNNFLKSKFQIV